MLTTALRLRCNLSHPSVCQPSIRSGSRSGLSCPPPACILDALHRGVRPLRSPMWLADCKPCIQVLHNLSTLHQSPPPPPLSWLCRRLLTYVQAAGSPCLLARVPAAQNDAYKPLPCLASLTLPQAPVAGTDHGAVGRPLMLPRTHPVKQTAASLVVGKQQKLGRRSRPLLPRLSRPQRIHQPLHCGGQLGQPCALVAAHHARLVQPRGPSIIFSCLAITAVTLLLLCRGWVLRPQCKNLFEGTCDPLGCLMQAWRPTIILNCGRSAAVRLLLLDQQQAIQPEHSAPQLRHAGW